MMNKEDEFFAKWLKQKQNLGDKKIDTSTLNASSTSKLGERAKKRDMTQIELDKVNQEIKKNETFKNYKVE